MNVARQKKEILSLLEKLHQGTDKEQASPEKKAPPVGAATPPIADRIRKRHQELVELCNRREMVAQNLLEEKLLYVCQMLDKRIATIEALIKDSGAKPKAPAPPKQPEKPAPQSSVKDGMDVENNLQEIMPDLGIPSAIASQGAAAAPPPKSRAPAAEPSLSGLIQDGILPDILQMISSNAKTGIFTLEHEGTKIDLFMRDGELCHALGQDMAGQTAFFAAMALAKGKFFFRETNAIPEDKTIDGNTQFMILEALRQIDEGQNNG